MPTKPWLISILTAPLLAATLAHAEAEADKKPTLEERLAERHYKIGEKVDRIPNYRVDGWNYIDRQHLILTGGASRRYLLTLEMSCTDLGSSEDIGFTSIVSMLTSLDTLIVKSPIGPQRCPIDEIHALEKIEKREGEEQGD